YVPAALAAGVPASVAVPLPLSMNFTPGGSAPDSLRTGVDWPVAVTRNEPAAPAAKVALAALVIIADRGAGLTVTLRFSLAPPPTPLLAMIVTSYVPPVPVAGVPSSAAVPSP